MNNPNATDFEYTPNDMNTRARSQSPGFRALPDGQYPTATITKTSGGSGTTTPTIYIMEGSEFSTSGFDTPNTTTLGGPDYFGPQDDVSRGHTTRHDCPSCQCVPRGGEPDCPEGEFNQEQLSFYASQLAPRLSASKVELRQRADYAAKAKIQKTIDEDSKEVWSIFHELSPENVPYRPYILGRVRGARQWTEEECKAEVLSLVCKAGGFPDNTEKAYVTTFNDIDPRCRRRA